jgi:hypothetical protein
VQRAERSGRRPARCRGHGCRGAEAAHSRQIAEQEAVHSRQRQQLEAVCSQQRAELDAAHSQRRETQVQGGSMLWLPFPWCEAAGLRHKAACAC